MSISIYLSNRNIQIAVGNTGKTGVQVQKLYHERLEEGSLLNGVITSESLLKEELEDIWSRHQLSKKNIRLIIESPQFFTKAITIPKFNDQKTIEAIKREFSDIADPEEHLYDYRVLEEHSKTGMVVILGIAVEKEFIKGYTDLFQSMDISIEKIDIAMNGELKLLNLLPNMEEETFINAHLDGHNLTCILMVNGQYTYFNRARIFSDHGTKDFGIEVGQRISAIKQFHAAEKFEQKIQDVYMGGFTEADYENCRTAIEQLGIDVRQIETQASIIIPDEHALCDYSYVMGNLITCKHDINIYTRYQKKIPTQEEQKKNRLMLLLGIVAGVCVLTFGALVAMNIQKQQQIDQADAYLTDKKNVKIYEESLALRAQIDQKQTQIQEVQQAWNVLSSYPKANSLIENAIVGCAGDKVHVSIDQYEAKTGVYEITARAPVVTDIYAFIDQLEQTKLFGNLAYSGYNYTDEIGQYDIHISGYLSEVAGK
ncbi:MAG: hypothetical protein RR717_01410 [Lachnospiraceae bacterium]